MIPKKRPPKVKIIQKENAPPVAVEVLAEEIQKISKAVAQIRAGKLKETTIVYLIHRSSGVSQGHVAAVLNSLNRLEQDYLK